MIPRPHACERCDGTSFWYVRQTRERSSGGAWALLGSIDEVAPLQALVCARCGHTRWYSGVRPQSTRTGSWRQRHERLCPDCAGIFQSVVPQVHEWPERWMGGLAVPLTVVRGRRGNGRGYFALRICDECGRCDWLAREVGTAEAAHGDQESCPECGLFGRRGVEPLREDGGSSLPVALVDDEPVGHFAVRFCDGCGYSHWFARDIGRLRADGERILFLSAESSRHVLTATSDGGPYR